MEVVSSFFLAKVPPNLLFFELHIPTSDGMNAQSLIQTFVTKKTMKEYLTVKSS